MAPRRVKKPEPPNLFPSPCEPTMDSGSSAYEPLPSVWFGTDAELSTLRSTWAVSGKD
jgi:hypothetical protein